MMYYATEGQIATDSKIEFLRDSYAVAGFHQAACPGADPPLPAIYFGAPQFDVFTPQPRQETAILNFNWNDPKARKDYARIEQKVLAGAADAEERRKFQQMKRSRKSKIFADRYLHDYVEARRLEQLSKKLSELQQFLRPIKLT
jgi:hypothetical protein